MSLLRLILIAVGLVLTACQGIPSGAAIAPANFPQLAPGLARVYFYRDYEPYESLSRPWIYLNGASTAISEPGGFSFRDVSPGEYTVSVDSPGLYPHQFKQVVLRAGDVTYVKILSLASWDSGIGRRRLGQRDTFVVEFIPDRQAQSELGQMRYMPGS